MLALLWLLVAYSFTRLCFLIGNFSVFSNLSTSEIAKSFVFGLRFDVAAILFTNAPVILLWLAPSALRAKPWWRRLEFATFIILNLFFIGMNVVDIEYYKFTGKRIAWDIFGIQKDVQQHSVNVILDYWQLALLWLAISGAVIWLYRIFPDVSTYLRSRLPGLLWRAVAIGLVVTGMRGGYQFKPLHPMNAYATTSAELGVLTLNSPFNFLKSRRKWGIPDAQFYSSRKEMVTRLHARQQKNRAPLGAFKDWNVVLIIVESFGTEYMPYAPHFSKLAKEGYYFEYNFANGRRSIEALPSILCGIPSLMNEPIVSSDFNNNEMYCLAQELLKNKYSTHFYHGAYNGSMYMDTFSKRAGFENFVGQSEYPADRKLKDDDKIWGILDEPMLQYTVEQMDQAPKPFFLGVFTLSSHNPYYIPPELRGKFPKGPLEIHESIGYADYALQKFLERAQKSDWFNRTIFIFTGDHTQKSALPQFQTELGRYRVPLLVYIPGQHKRLNYNPKHISQHIDIQPTVFDLLGVRPEAKTLLGQSAFDDSQSYAFNFDGASWWYLDNRHKLKVRITTKEANYFVQQDDLFATEDPNLKESQQSLLLDFQALIQYTIQGIVTNSLYQWEKDL